MKRVILMSLLGLICFTSVNAQTKKVVKPTKATVEVLYFHSKQRCPTCIAVGTYSKEVVDKDFAAQVKSGAVKFMAYSIAGTAKATAQYTGDREKLQIAQCMRKVKGDMEMSWFWGERGIQNASTTPRRFTGGMKSQIVTNTYNPASTITFAQFSDNVLAAAGRYGSNQKLLFAGENIIRCLDRWAFDKMFLYSDDDSLGFKTKRVTSSFVDLVVVRHKLFRGTALANKGFIVDADNIRRVVLRGRDMHWEKEIQANDFDGKAGNILAEVGFELTLEETHMYLDGISGPT